MLEMYVNRIMLGQNIVEGLTCGGLSLFLKPYFRTPVPELELLNSIRILVPSREERLSLKNPFITLSGTTSLTGCTYADEPLASSDGHSHRRSLGQCLDYVNTMYLQSTRRYGVV